MSISDVFLLVVRWVHLTSSAIWIGGSLFYLLVLRPAQARSIQSDSPMRTATATEFRALSDTCIFVILITGIILTFDRLAGNIVDMPYVVALTIKIILSVWMFTLAQKRHRRTALMDEYQDVIQTPSRLQKVARTVSGYNAIVILGIIVFLLSDLLKVLFEMALKGS